MNMKYIRNYYKVPAKRGGCVMVNGWGGRIISAVGPYLKIRLDKQSPNCANLYHPTDERLKYYQSAQQSVHPTLGESATSQAVISTETLSTSDGVPPSAPARVA